MYIKNGQGFLSVYAINSQSSMNELVEMREQIIRGKDTTKVSFF